MIRLNIHFEVGYNPEKRDWTYVLTSWLAWVCCIVFGVFYPTATRDYLGKNIFMVLRFVIPLLFIYPVYTIGKSLWLQWKVRTVFLLDLFLCLLFVVMALLVFMDEFYIRQEWLNWIKDRLLVIH